MTPQVQTQQIFRVDPDPTTPDSIPGPGTDPGSATTDPTPLAHTGGDTASAAYGAAVLALFAGCVLLLTGRARRRGLTG